VGRDKDHNLPSHDTAPPSKDANLLKGNQGTKSRKEVTELGDL
jgi:hypothetical protein